MNAATEVYNSKHKAVCSHHQSVPQPAWRPNTGRTSEQSLLGRLRFDICNIDHMQIKINIASRHFPSPAPQEEEEVSAEQRCDSQEGS